MKPLKIQVFQHVPFEGPEAIEKFFTGRGHRLQIRHLYSGASPNIEQSVDALIIMGGPMSTSDDSKYSWLSEEKSSIKEAIQRDMPILGICLGAQLLAEALGARVQPMGFREIGWFPVRTNPVFQDHPLGQSFPETFTALHWHGYTFSLPPDSIPLGSSTACGSQGFVHGDWQIGLQFHLELGRTAVAALAKECNDEVDGSKFVQDGQKLLEPAESFESANNLLERFLAQFTEAAQGRRTTV